jgi:hypothetical protein
MAWYDRLDPTTANGMQLSGLLGGLNAMGAGLMQAGQMRPLGTPAPTFADALGAFGHGQQRGLLGAKQQRDMKAMQAFGAALAPDADEATMDPATLAIRNAVPANMRPILAAMPSDMQTQTMGSLLTRKTNPKDNLMEVGGSIYDVSSGKPVFLERASKLLSPDEVAQQRMIRAAGAPRMSVNMPRAETEFEREYGKGLSGMALEILKGADKAFSTISTLDRMEELLPQITAGKFGPALMTLTGFGQAMGISPENLKRLGLPESATPNELFNMLAAKTVAANIGGEGGVPAANFSNADMAFVKQMEAGLSSRPETIGMAIAARRKVAERSIEAAESWNAARAEGKTYDKWQSDWRRYVNANPLFAGSEWRPAAAATPARSGVQAEPPPNPPPRITSPQQFQMLPSGAVFIAPDGTTRQKP